MHRRLTLTRNISSDQGTFGSLAGPGLVLFTAELPWRGNQANVSCIPAGVYECRPYSSQKYSDVYQLLEVPYRSQILIHAGNWAGDKDKGLRSDVEGCILVGLTIGELRGQQAVMSSRVAMDHLRRWAGKQGFTLAIEDNYR